MTVTTGENQGYELPLASGFADSLCVMIHGYGADGEDMINVAGLMSQFLPTTYFVAPNAPEPCLTAPGFYQWYGIEQGAAGADIAAESLAPRINQYADLQLERLEIDPRNLVMLGFSQGGGIMLEAVLRREQACRCALIFTGSLRNRDRLDDVIRSRPPVMFIHGDSDPVVPVHHVENAISALERHGVNCAAHICAGLEHSMNEEGAMIGAMFAAECLMT